MNVTSFSIAGALLAYACVVLGSILTKVHNTPSRYIPGKQWQILSCTMIALICHALLLKQTIFQEGSIDMGLFNALSVIAWLAIVLLFGTRFFKPTDNLLPFACLFGFIVICIQPWLHQRYLLPSDMSGGLKVHILLSIVAYSLLSIATLQSLVLHLQHRALHTKHTTAIHNLLPPLQTMEYLLIQLLLAGFFLLSLSLISGMMFVVDLLNQHLVHKSVLSAIAWCVYGVLLLGRWRYGWRGVTLTRYVFSAFLLLCLSYFGSKLALELILDKR